MDNIEANSTAIPIRCGEALRNVVFYCPNSVNCLTSEQGSNLLTCPLMGGRHNCKAWKLRKMIEDDAPIFWYQIVQSLFHITEEDLVYPERMQLADEQKTLLSLLFWGIETYRVENRFQMPKSWGTTEKILKDLYEKPRFFPNETIQTLWNKNSALWRCLLKEFQNNPLSQKSQKEIIVLLYLFKSIIEENCKPINDQEPEEQLISDIMTNLFKL